MAYLIAQIVLCLLLAFALGLLLGWLLWRRASHDAEAELARTRDELEEAQGIVRRLEVMSPAPLSATPPAMSETLGAASPTQASGATFGVHAPVPDRPGPSTRGAATPKPDAPAAAPSPEASEPPLADEPPPVEAPPAAEERPTAAAFLDDDETPAPAVYRSRDDEPEATPEAGPEAKPEAAAPPESPAEDPRPDPTATDAPLTYDDLKRISGIGPVIERQLAEMGVTTYRQIARFTEEDIERVGQHIDFFPDRIRREGWVVQAAALHRELYGTQP